MAWVQKGFRHAMMSLDYLKGGKWSGMGVEWKSVGAKLKIIKMARMAKSWNGVDIIYE